MQDLWAVSTLPLTCCASLNCTVCTVDHCLPLSFTMQDQFAPINCTVLYRLTVPSQLYYVESLCPSQLFNSESLCPSQLFNSESLCPSQLFNSESLCPPQLYVCRIIVPLSTYYVSRITVSLPAIETL
jgi:hypothetical protein